LNLVDWAAAGPARLAHTVRARRMARAVSAGLLPSRFMSDPPFEAVAGVSVEPARGAAKLGTAV
jgi:hypothetical protein